MAKDKKAEDSGNRAKTKTSTSDKSSASTAKKVTPVTKTSPSTAKTSLSTDKTDTSVTANKTKKAPTPKRSEAEKKNLRPLVAPSRGATKKKLTPEEKAKYKLERSELRAKQQEALKTGDERYLPERDRGKVKKFVRNWVDSRVTLIQFFLPIAIVVLIFSSFMQSYSIYISFIASLVVYGYILIAVILMALQSFKLKKALREEFGESAVAKGSGNISYALSRMTQPKFTRLPKVGV